MHGRLFAILPAWLLSVLVVVMVSPPVRAQNGETLSYYTLRFEFSTTSDWSTISLDSGPVWNSRLVSQSGNLVSVSVGRSGANIVQAIDDAVAGQEVSVVFDSALPTEAFGQLDQCVAHVDH